MIARLLPAWFLLALTAVAPVGSVHRLAPALDALIAPDARLERIAEGPTWAEGPVWIADDAALLFSDPPRNRIYRWSAGAGLSVFLAPSGLAGDTAGFREPGSNGMIAGPDGSLLIASSGERAIVRLDRATHRRTVLASRYAGRRFNSPNDLVRAANGAIYFTDPPYGLDGLDASPLKEQPANGVYRLDPDGTVTLIDASLGFPNGVSLSPDGRTLYVSNSDPARAVWIAYALDARGDVTGRRVFADMTASVGAERPGLPDGMKVDARGNLFASGPGGLMIFSPAGILLGRIDAGTVISNCVFGADGHTLFMTAGHAILRLPTLTTGLGAARQGRFRLH
jgi:gluconolactonase